MLVCEAQLRWNHPVLGDLPWRSAKLSPVALDTDAKATAWTLKIACAQLLGWQSIGLRGISMIIRLQGAHLVDEAFAAFMVKTIANAQLHDGTLELALTNAELLLHPCPAWTHLKALRKLGVTIGFSNLTKRCSDWQQLRALPIDRLTTEHRFLDDVCPAGNETSSDELPCSTGVHLSLPSGQTQAFSAGPLLLEDALLKRIFPQDATEQAPLTRSA
jgi:EAL domain-containing protein (putative c-di-GMP-specific phosphodiesterase class I)